MKIRGNTVGTNIAPERVLTKVVAYGGLNMHYQDIRNAAGLLLSHYDHESEKKTGGVWLSAGEDVTGADGRIKGVLEFSQWEYDQDVILRRVADGIDDHDVATVGQLKAATAGGSGGSLSAKVVDDVFVVTVVGGLSASIKDGVLVVA